MFTVLAFGNSLTAGFGVSPGHSFAERLQQVLGERGEEVRVINGGVSGDTTYDGLRRLAPLLEYSPDLVILEFGVNDFFMGMRPENIRANLESMIDSCQSRGANVLLAGFLSLRQIDGRYEQGYHRIYEDISRFKDVSLFPDFLPDIPYNPELTLPDGIHPNEAGIDKIVQDIVPFVQL